VLLAVCGLSAPGALLRGADQSELLNRANHAYYDARRDGLTGFRCQVVPDWDQIYSNIKADATGEELLTFRRQTHFEVSIGPDGASTVSRKSELAAPNQQIAERLRRATAAVEQVLTGFFQTWSMFFGPPFPTPDDKSLKLEDLDGQYRITGKQGQAEIFESMNRELMITEMKVAVPGTEITLLPKFSRLPKGYVFIGYEGTTKTASGTMAVEVTIENQEVEGFGLPKTVTVNVGGNIRIPLDFRSCEIKKRN
jgi:hypothetical protein